MLEQIPIWFYLITSVIYSSSALIGFLVSYFAFKSYRMTKNKSHLFLCLSFLVIGLGIAVLASTSIYIYSTLQIYKGSAISLNLLNYLGFRTYYILSAIGYVLLTLLYLPKKVMNKLFILYVPIWRGSEIFFNVAIADNIAKRLVFGLSGLGTFSVLTLKRPNSPCTVIS